MPRRKGNTKLAGLQVIVTVSGGVADLLFKSPGVAVALYDYDVDGADEQDPGISKDPDGHTCCIREWDPSAEVAGCENWPVIRQARSAVYSRTWRCPGCGRGVNLSYEELAISGLPICCQCDAEMEME